MIEINKEYTNGEVRSIIEEALLRWNAPGD